MARQVFTRYKRPRVVDFAGMNDLIQSDYRQIVKNAKTYGIVRNGDPDTSFAFTLDLIGNTVSIGTGLLFDNPATNGTSDLTPNRVIISNAAVTYNALAPLAMDGQSIPQPIPTSTGSSLVPILYGSVKDTLITIKYLETVDITWPEYYLESQVHGYSRRLDGYIITAVEATAVSVAAAIAAGEMFLGVITKDGEILYEAYGYGREYMHEVNTDFKLDITDGAALFFKCEVWIDPGATAAVKFKGPTSGWSQETAVSVGGTGAWYEYYIEVPQELYLDTSTNPDGLFNISLKSTGAADSDFVEWRNLVLGPSLYRTVYDVPIRNYYFGIYTSLGVYSPGPVNAVCDGWSASVTVGELGWFGIVNTGLSGSITALKTQRLPADATNYGTAVSANISLPFLYQISGYISILDGSITGRKISSNLVLTGTLNSVSGTLPLIGNLTLTTGNLTLVSGSITIPVTTRYYSVPPAGFTGRKETDPYDKDGDGSIFQNTDLGGVVHQYHAMVNLPHGATVVSLKCYYYRDDAAASGYIIMYRKAGTNTVQQVTPQLTFAGVGGWTNGTIAATVGHEVIDNLSYGYHLTLNIDNNDNTGDIKFDKAIITYTVTSSLP